MNKDINIRPQEGPQQEFLMTNADIAIYGGGAGGGKTYALLMEPLRFIKDVKGFGAVIFRRTNPQIRNEGALWDTSLGVYKYLGAVPKESTLEWVFPHGNRIKFSHMEYDKNMYDWQGSQVALICYDELTQFSKEQFFYMLSRNRSMCGVKPYVRATCNPDCDSWVAEFISWWIDQNTGYAIKERSGVVRWFIRESDEIQWFDTKKEAVERCKKIGKGILPKSVTFIHASISDNKILLKTNPEYLSNLNALPSFERAQLLDGNWKIKRSAGMYFKRETIPIVDTIPAGGKECRYWDRAATEVSPSSPDPDWTVGVKMMLMPNGEVFIKDIRRFRERPAKVEENIKNTTVQDQISCAVCGEQEPGASGKAEADNYVRLLQGFNVHFFPSTSDKVTRALPFSAQCERGNVKLLRAPWNEAFLKELEDFDGNGKTHDDQVDAASGAYNYLAGAKTPLTITVL